jgi:hypothetical protein
MNSQLPFELSAGCRDIYFQEFRPERSEKPGGTGGSERIGHRVGNGREARHRPCLVASARDLPEEVTRNSEGAGISAAACKQARGQGRIVAQQFSENIRAQDSRLTGHDRGVVVPDANRNGIAVTFGI